MLDGLLHDRFAQVEMEVQPDAVVLRRPWVSPEPPDVVGRKRDGGRPGGAGSRADSDALLLANGRRLPRSFDRDRDGPFFDFAGCADRSHGQRALALAAAGQKRQLAQLGIADPDLPRAGRGKRQAQRTASPVVDHT